MIPFSNSLKVFYLHLELPSDQENSNDLVVERLWFAGREKRRRFDTFRDFIIS